MDVALGADHAGFEHEQRIKARGQEFGHEARDRGTHHMAPGDDPDFAAAVRLAVRARRAAS